MRMKRHLLTAAMALFCLSAANAQLLRTTVEQGEIEGVEHEGFGQSVPPETIVHIIEDTFLSSTKVIELDNFCSEKQRCDLIP